MEFALSEEQGELASTVRAVLTKQADSTAVRAAIATDEGYDKALWSTLCEQVGVAALAIPEEYDGAGATFFETAVVLEELGRSLAPSPLLASVIAGEALLAGGSDDAKARLLPRIAAGEIATLALGDGPVLDADRAAIVLAVDGDDLVEVTGASATWAESMDQTIRLGDLDRSGATSHADRRRSGRSRPRRARRTGGGSCARGRSLRPGAPDDGRLQQGAGPVRQADRLVPGPQAPDGRHAGPARDRPVRVLGRVLRARHRERPTPKS